MSIIPLFSPLQSRDPVLCVPLLQVSLAGPKVCCQEVYRTLRAAANLLQQQTWSPQDPQDRYDFHLICKNVSHTCINVHICI